ncbi:MAG TPA: hypothetical protein VN176_13425, partial [Verrucomicrobiae bacterium]|nr:hypothetical protein [Verrucomicrobiae bacterium]
REAFQKNEPEIVQKIFLRHAFPQSKSSASIRPALEVFVWTTQCSTSLCVEQSKSGPSSS